MSLQQKAPPPPKSVEGLLAQLANLSSHKHPHESAAAAQQVGLSPALPTGAGIGEGGQLATSEGPWAHLEHDRGVGIIGERYKQSSSGMLSSTFGTGQTTDAQVPEATASNPAFYEQFSKLTLLESWPTGGTDSSNRSSQQLPVSDLNHPGSTSSTPPKTFGSAATTSDSIVPDSQIPGKVPRSTCRALNNRSGSFSDHLVSTPAGSQSNAQDAGSTLLGSFLQHQSVQRHQDSAAYLFDSYTSLQSSSYLFNDPQSAVQSQTSSPVPSFLLESARGPNSSPMLSGDQLAESLLGSGWDSYDARASPNSAVHSSRHRTLPLSADGPVEEQSAATQGAPPAGASAASMLLPQIKIYTHPPGKRSGASRRRKAKIYQALSAMAASMAAQNGDEEAAAAAVAAVAAQSGAEISVMHGMQIRSLPSAASLSTCSSRDPGSGGSSKGKDNKGKPGSSGGNSGPSKNIHGHMVPLDPGSGASSSKHHHRGHVAAEAITAAAAAAAAAAAGINPLPLPTPPLQLQQQSAGQQQQHLLQAQQQLGAYGELGYLPLTLQDANNALLLQQQGNLRALQTQGGAVRLTQQQLHSLQGSQALNHQTLMLDAAGSPYEATWAQVNRSHPGALRAPATMRSVLPASISSAAPAYVTLPSGETGQLVTLPSGQQVLALNTGDPRLLSLHNLSGIPQQGQLLQGAGLAAGIGGTTGGLTYVPLPTGVQQHGMPHVPVLLQQQLGSGSVSAPLPNAMLRQSLSSQQQQVQVQPMTFPGNLPSNRPQNMQFAPGMQAPSVALLQQLRGSGARLGGSSADLALHLEARHRLGASATAGSGSPAGPASSVMHWQNQQHNR